MSPNDLIRTAWVAPASQVGGQDHLAVRAVGESLYTRLLPGISNVTERIHCYAFYTWFIRAYERSDHERTVPAFRRLFRRAECLHTLLAAYHGGERMSKVERAAQPGDDQSQRRDSHGGGLVGRNTLLPVLEKIREGSRIDLGCYAIISATKERYFKHSLGGFGQYYLGPMRGLGLITGDSRSGVKWTRERGLPVAEAFERFIGEDICRLFMDTASKGEVGVAELEALARLCPCHLAHATEVRDLLLAMFLAEHDEPLEETKVDADRRRRHTVLLILAIAEVSRKDLDRRFRKYTYAGALAKGSSWVLPPDLEQTRAMWSTYQRHELFSVAMQGLFCVGLRRFRKRTANLDGVHFRSVADYVAAYMAKGVGFDQDWLDRPFPALVQETAQDLPSLDDFHNDDHEFQRASRISELTEGKDDPDGWTKAFVHSIRILLILAARGHGDQVPYSKFIHPPRYFDNYELNLRSFAHHCEHTWAAMTGGEWIEWLLGRGTLRVHFRVALRKLRHQRKDTFRVAMLDEGLLVERQALVRWTSPRINEVIRALTDLGLLVPDARSLTPFGREILEARRNG